MRFIYIFSWLYLLRLIILFREHRKCLCVYVSQPSLIKKALCIKMSKYKMNDHLLTIWSKRQTESRKERVPFVLGAMCMSEPIEKETNNLSFIVC